MQLFNNLNHVALLVSDLERSLTFYRDVLGLDEMFTLRDDSGNIIMIMLRVNDGNFLELQPGGDNQVKNVHAAPRCSHLSLQTDDMRATLDELSRRGIATDPSRITKGRTGSLLYGLFDPDGIGIELVQYTDDSLLLKTLATRPRN